jgi:hypothetical protein
MNTKLIAIVVGLISIWLLSLGGCEVSTSGGFGKELSVSMSPGTAKVADLPGAGIVCKDGVAKSVTPACVALSEDGSNLNNNCGKTVSVTVNC